MAHTYITIGNDNESSLERRKIILVYRSAVAASAYNPSGQISNSPHSLGPPMNSLNRSRSRSPSQYNDRRSLSPNFARKSLAPPMRSRSPTPNFTSTHQTKLSTNRNLKPSNSPSTSPVHQAKFASGKNNCTQHITSIQIPVDNRVSLKSEASLQVIDALTDHSDTTSELSDEGYRSLGIVQDKSKQRSSFISQNSAEDAEDNGNYCCIHFFSLNVNRSLKNIKTVKNTLFKIEKS